MYLEETKSFTDSFVICFKLYYIFSYLAAAMYYIYY